MGETGADGADTGTSYADRAISWEHTGNGELPYRARAGGAELLVRVNDFPAEPLYSLLVDGRLDRDLEDWPARWTRPGDAVAALGLTGTLTEAIGYRLLEPPPPGAGRFEISESRGGVFTVRVTLTTPGTSRADLDALLGPGSAVPRVHYDSPFQLCYRVTVPGAPCSCDVFAAFAGAPDGPGAVPESLMFRRQAVRCRCRAAGGQPRPGPRPGKSVRPDRCGRGSAPRPVPYR